MVGFVVTGPIRALGSNKNKNKKSLSPLGKVPHSSIGVFSLYLSHVLSFCFCSCIFN